MREKTHANANRQRHYLERFLAGGTNVMFSIRRNFLQSVSTGQKCRRKLRFAELSRAQVQCGFGLNRLDLVALRNRSVDTTHDFSFSVKKRQFDNFAAMRRTVG